MAIPADLRRRYGLEEASTAIAEAARDGFLLRPAVTGPIELYTAERKAEFLLSNAVDQTDYEWARDRVRRSGLDPDSIAHRRPLER